MKRTVTEVLHWVDAFFMGESEVHTAAARICRELQDLGIPFAVAGALAANVHGHRRTTADVDLLMTREGLAAFKQRWLGRGWIDIFPGSKGMRDAQHQVKIDVLLTGEFPGDGKPKPVRFPDPAPASEPGADGLPYLRLPVLIELKLASGMTAPHRAQDLADVIGLIRANGLAADYALKLDPYVRDKYRELWQAAQVQEDY